MTTAYHKPVLLAEVLEVLDCKKGDVVVDATIGGGGHARGILERIAPEGLLIGIDRDPAAIAAAGENLRDFSEQVRLLHGRHEEISDLLEEAGAPPVNGILLDLGISSRHVDDSARGFSYRQNGPLDMRMDTTQGQTAADVLNKYAEDDLTTVFKKWGEERWAARVAQYVVKRRHDKPFETTDELVETIRAAIPAGARRASKGHPARRVFQALRIEVNGEISGLTDALESAQNSLAPGGRAAIISYHSLEDRAAKRKIAELAADGRARIVTKKAVKPSKRETERNPRARSARLRAWEAVG